MKADLLPNKKHFTEEGLENIVGFYEVLLRVHDRLIVNGYVFKDGKITPPPVAKEVAKRKKAKSD